MSQALEVCGQVRQPGSFDFEALTRLPGQIEDIAPLVPGRTGGGVRLASLLDAVQPHPEATHLTVESTDGSFSASVPLAIRFTVVSCPATISTKIIEWSSLRIQTRTAGRQLIRW